MLLIATDRSSAVPVYRQICRRIAQLIDEGSLEPGERLPPTRNLASALGVHRSTVVRAYDECRAEGYLESTAGSYTRVRARARFPVAKGDCLRNVIDWDTAAIPDLGALPDLPSVPDGTIDFDTFSSDPVLSPVDMLKRCVKQAIADHGAEVLGYTDPKGWPPLRKSIAERLCLHGMSVAAEQILITNGAHQALDLVLRMLVRPDDSIAVEAPSYGMFHRLTRLHRIRVMEIPMTETGMDLEALGGTLTTGTVKLLYTMPNFQNPTGITTDQGHRERLIEMCESAGVPIVEDGFEEEMKYSGKAALPIKAIDTGGIVIYVGSFSKVVFSGLRVGWIAAPENAIARLAAIQQASCLSVNTLSQAALHRFCGDGQFDSYLRRIHTVYRRRMQRMLHGLEHSMPPSVSWTRPVGGYTLWLTVGGQGKESAIRDACSAAGVAIAPGQRFYASECSTHHFRLSIACVDEAQIDEGCRRLGEVLGSLRLS